MVRVSSAILVASAAVALATPGKCTYYEYGGTGACGTPIAKGVAICALGKSDNWKAHCGKKIHFSNSKGSGSCEVRDECPECEEGHLDMTLAAFLKVCTVKEGVCKIDWHFEGEETHAFVAMVAAPNVTTKATAASSQATNSDMAVEAQTQRGSPVSKHSRCTYYNPSNNDPPGSLDGAYRTPLIWKGQASISSAAHAMKGASPYKKGGVYTVVGGKGDKFCVRIDDTCAACKGTWFDIFLKDGDSLPYDFCDVYEGCDGEEGLLVV